MNYKVASAAEAKTVLDYFNGFHDSFIRRLSLVSHDVFEARGVQASSERLGLDLILAHYNYQEDRKPVDTHITARFYEVTHLGASFSGLQYEWSVYELFITEAQRTLEDGRAHACLQATLLQSRLSEARSWQRHEDLTFRFARAEFEEP